MTLQVLGKRPSSGEIKHIAAFKVGQQLVVTRAIANRLKADFLDHESMCISHEAIYQALYIQGRGALKRELVGCLRTGRALCVSRASARVKAWTHVSEAMMTTSRPERVKG